jgi:hypothetical protein
MKLGNYLTEFTRAQYGDGITFVDIDETMFKTFAKIIVKKSGKVVRELDNQEFNSYKLKDGEVYDFHQFRDAEFFRKTSIPIPQTFARIKKMIAQIKAMDTGSKIVFLTARVIFPDIKEFKKAFSDQGIKIDGNTVDVSFMPKGSPSIPDSKKKRMMEYIKTGDFRRVRLIDDHKPNLKTLKDIENTLPVKIEQKVIDKHGLDMSTEKLPPISFYALWIDDNGNLKEV